MASCSIHGTSASSSDGKSVLHVVLNLWYLPSSVYLKAMSTLEEGELHALLPAMPRMNKLLFIAIYASMVANSVEWLNKFQEPHVQWIRKDKVTKICHWIIWTFRYLEQVQQCHMLSSCPSFINHCNMEIHHNLIRPNYTPVGSNIKYCWVEAYAFHSWKYH